MIPFVHTEAVLYFVRHQEQRGEQQVADAGPSEPSTDEQFLSSAILRLSQSVELASRGKAPLLFRQSLGLLRNIIDTRLIRSPQRLGQQGAFLGRCLKNVAEALSIASNRCV